MICRYYKQAIHKQTHKMTDNQVEDYPFTSWKTFYPAFSEYYSLDGCKEKYPKLDYAFENTEVSPYSIILDFLEKGYNPQEGLDGLFQAILNCSRYHNDIIENFSDVVKKFIMNGAVVNIDSLIIPKLENETVENIICDEHAEHRAYMLYVLKIEGIIPDMDQILNEKLKWENIDPCYWEDLDYESNDNTLVLSAFKYEYTKTAYRTWCEKRI